MSSTLFRVSVDEFDQLAIAYPESPYIVGELEAANAQYEHYRAG